MNAIPKSPSIHDVARLAEVSIATVSLATHHPDRIAPATVARVRAAVHELNYKPLRTHKNRALSVVTLGQLGVLFPDRKHPSSPQIEQFNIMIARGANERLVTKGTQLLVSQISPSDEVPIMLSENHVGGVIARSSSYAPEVMSLLKGLPMVWVSGPSPGALGMDLVQANNFCHGTQAANFLISTGIRRVKVIKPECNLTEEHHQRALGCVLELAKAGVSADELTSSSLLEEPHFSLGESTGIYVTGNDEDLVTIYQRLENFLPCPAGFPPMVGTLTNEDIAALLTDRVHVLGMNPIELGKRAADCLMWRIDNPYEAAVTIQVPPLKISKIPLART